MKTEILVIGSGSSGLTTAIGLAKIGYKVTIIESEYFGGDCTNFGCIPSKALLSRAAEYYNSKEYNTRIGISVSEEIYANQADKVLEETRNVVWEFREHESLQWLENQGLTVVHGTASFVNPHEVTVENIHWELTSTSIQEGNNRTSATPTNTINITFGKAIVCTGSSTFIPAITGIEDVPYLTNKTIFSLTTVPKDITIIGNGPIGVEMAEAFLHLGSNVTMVGRSEHILPRSEASLAIELQKTLELKGLQYLNADTESLAYSDGLFTITLSGGETNTEFQTIESEQVLIATGRQPNLPDRLDLAGIKYSQQGIEINSKTRTSSKDIYAVGDVVSGVPKFTHFAGYMGAKVVTNLAIRKFTKLPWDLVSYSTKHIPAITFTSPELAECGYTYKEAQKQFGEKNVRTFVLSFNDIDRAKAHDHEQGSIILITKGFWARIIGVHILGSRGGEMLPELQRLITEGKTIRALSAIIRAYPSYTANLDTLFKQWLSSLVIRK